MPLFKLLKKNCELRTGNWELNCQLSTLELPTTSVKFGVSDGIRTRDSRSHSPELYP